ncbi:MAG: 8-amino-7-oxononanoate synthase [Porticoccaceae bacterium]|jgi:8-amino-7-oxononanoate synthase|nr:8-amino-7-oxononanoate synthase [Porticoccaceae bacterium]
MNWHQQLASELEAAEAQHLRRVRNVVSSPQGPEISLDRQLINFCSNDYLGFANHPKLIEAAVAAAKKWGVGSGASHLVCGHQELAEDFERDFADFVGAEAALLFSTGYMANFAVINAFFDREGVILQDKLNHASLIDAGRLSRASLQRYSHSDMDSLESRLRELADKPALMATDAVFSMDGDLADLSSISSLAESYGALAYFDDAHGFGVLGVQGRGSLNSQNLRPRGNNLMLATMGKALGSFGAVVAGDQVFVNTLIQKARPYIYTTALPPTVIATNAAALSLLVEEGWRRDHLHTLINGFREEAKSIGLELMESDTPIQPLIVGDNSRALECSAKLREAGILVTAIRPPTVPEGSARLRITLTAAHSEDHLRQLLEALSKLKSEGLL